MDELTRLLQDNYAKSFAEHGATPKGVDYNDEAELIFRYGKMLAVLDRDFERPASPPSLLDVGCGWGGLYKASQANGIKLVYTGIDIVEPMIIFARETFREARFEHGDVFALCEQNAYDYVVCNGILTQKLTATIPQMEAYARQLIHKMFDLCRYGIAVSLMSTRVNFMASNLYYQNPQEILHFCLTELSPKVRLDHGYSSLQTGRGKFYDYVVYVYKD